MNPISNSESPSLPEDHPEPPTEPLNESSAASSSPPKSEPDAIMAGFDEEAAALKDLTENVRDQDELERDITNQANRALIEVEDKRDQKRIEKAEQTREKLQLQKRTQQQKLRAAAANPTARLRI